VVWPTLGSKTAKKQNRKAIVSKTVSNKCIAVRKVASPLQELTCHIGWITYHHIISYHTAYEKFRPIMCPLLREPRPQVHYKSQPNAKRPIKTQKSTNVKILTEIV